MPYHFSFDALIHLPGGSVCYNRTTTCREIAMYQFADVLGRVVAEQEFGADIDSFPEYDSGDYLFHTQSEYAPRLRAFYKAHEATLRVQLTTKLPYVTLTESSSHWPLLVRLLRAVEDRYPTAHLAVEVVQPEVETASRFAVTQNKHTVKITAHGDLAAIPAWWWAFAFLRVLATVNAEEELRFYEVADTVAMGESLMTLTRTYGNCWYNVRDAIDTAEVWRDNPQLPVYQYLAQGVGPVRLAWLHKRGELEP
jgi:hypothetical protein